MTGRSVLVWANGVLVAFALAGCPRSQSNNTATIPSGPQAQAPQQWRAARLDLTAEVADLDDALTKGDVTRYLSHFAQDPNSLMVGSAPDEIYQGPQTFSETIRRSMSRGGILVRQTDLATFATQDGSGGWAYSEFDVLTSQPDRGDGGERGDRIVALPMRMTLVFERGQDNRFKIVAGHTSVAFKNEDLLTRVQAGTFPNPTPIIEHVTPNGTELWQAVSAMQQGGYEAVRRMTANDPTVLVVGSGPGEHWTGPDYAGEPRPSELPELKPAYGAAHVWVSARGTLGFVTYTVGLAGEGERPVVVPTRVTEVYERRAEGWKRVHAHSSAGVPPNELAAFMVPR